MSSASSAELSARATVGLASSEAAARNKRLATDLVPTAAYCTLLPLSVKTAKNIKASSSSTWTVDVGLLTPKWGFD